MRSILGWPVFATLFFASMATGAEDSPSDAVLGADAQREAATQVAECALLAVSAPTRFDRARREAMMEEALEALAEAGAAHIAAVPQRYGNAGLGRMPPEFFAGYFFRMAQERMSDALLRDGVGNDPEAFVNFAVSRFETLGCVARP